MINLKKKINTNLVDTFSHWHDECRLNPKSQRIIILDIVILHLLATTPYNSSPVLTKMFFSRSVSQLHSITFTDAANLYFFLSSSNLNAVKMQYSAVNVSHTSGHPAGLCVSVPATLTSGLQGLSVRLTHLRAVPSSRWAVRYNKHMHHILRATNYPVWGAKRTRSCEHQ